MSDIAGAIRKDHRFNYGYKASLPGRQRSKYYLGVYREGLKKTTIPSEDGRFLGPGCTRFLLNAVFIATTTAWTDGTGGQL